MTSSDSLEITKPSELELRWTRAFSATPELVFEALTTPKLVQQWLTGPPGMTMPVCEIDLRVGGRFRYVWRKADGTEMGMGGEFKEITRPEKIVHTELFDEDWTGGETLVTTELTRQGDGTLLTCTVRYSSTAVRDSAVQTGMEDGVTNSYNVLDAVLTK